jgi:hypothetical protein
MPHGKPAGIPCVNLLPDLRCALFGKPERPAFCTSLRPTESMCGANRADALARLTALELATEPEASPHGVRAFNVLLNQSGGNLAEGPVAIVIR